MIDRALAKTLRMFSTNCLLGPVGKPRVDHLRGPIWEMRSKIGNRIARVLFAVEQSQMILLHGFIKKTQQTDPADIDLAIKRLKEWTNG